MNFTRESIFISSLRGFFKSFAVVLGFAVGLVTIVLGINALSDGIITPNKSEMTISADANWNRKMLASTAPVILRVDIEGVIGTSKLTEKKIKDLLIDSREGSLANNRVKGVLLYLNTPGGTSSDSSAIYRLIKTYKEKYKVPVFAFVDGMCASGGVYITSAADQIFAPKDSIIGSVGVRLGPAFNFSNAMDKWGIQALTLTEGKNKDTLNPFRPWKEGEDESLKTILAAEYEIFVDVVTAARPKLDKDKLINDYGANIFTAQKAEEIGFIDNGDADYDLALSSLVKASGIKDGEQYQVISIAPYQSVVKELTENKAHLLKGKLTHVFPTGTYTNSEMSGQILFLYQP